MELLRERNTATTIYFPVRKAGSSDFATSSDWTPASGDVQYSVDGGAYSNTTNLPSHEGNGTWSLSLVAGEVSGKVTVITVIDSATKVVQDQAVIVQTWGDDSAGVPLNALVDYWMNRNMATARASSRGDGTGRNPIQALGAIRNKKDPSGSQIIVRQEDDSTEDFRFDTTTDSGADPITGLDPTT